MECCAHNILSQTFWPTDFGGCCCHLLPLTQRNQFLIRLRLTCCANRSIGLVAHTDVYNFDGWVTIVSRRYCCRIQAATDSTIRQMSAGWHAWSHRRQQQRQSVSCAVFATPSQLEICVCISLQGDMRTSAHVMLCRPLLYTLVAQHKQKPQPKDQSTHWRYAPGLCIQTYQTIQGTCCFKYVVKL